MKIDPQCLMFRFPLTMEYEPWTSREMSGYKEADFEDDDRSSMGTIPLTDVSSTPMHLRYSMGGTLWRSRSLLEKALIVLVALLSLIVFILSLIVSYSTQNHSLRLLQIGSHPTDHNCLTPDCIATAARMLSYVNLSVNPCDDFYEFSCGGWMRDNPIPDGKSIWGTFGKLEEQNQIIVKRLLENTSMILPAEAELMARRYYNSCMDANNTMDKLGAAPLSGLIAEVDGWNITHKLEVKNWTLLGVLKVLQLKYSMSGLFSWFIGENDKNSTHYVIEIDQGGLTLPSRDNYLNKTVNANILKAYLKYMTKVGVLLGGEENETRRQMQDIIDFETSIAEITVPSEELRDEEKNYHRMTLADLQKKAPFISWRDYFAEAFKSINRPVTWDEKVVVFVPDYMEKLSVLVNKTISTDNGKIKMHNYLVWQTVKSLTSCLSKPFRDASDEFRKALIGSKGGEDLWRYCVTDTNSVLGFAVGAMFVRQVFQGNSKTVAENMINETRNAFKENLKNLQWMDEETRLAADNKANAISDMIGFPEYILDPAELDKEYQDLVIKENEYFQNNIRVNQFLFQKNIAKIDQLVNKTRWDIAPFAVNAYYTPTKNQIVFPAGILRSPFYSIKHPTSVNFGAMGMVMGHELTHAFDDQGREYDQYGNLNQWWNNATIARFKKRAECVVKQYSKYKINGNHLNGKNLLGENIADNGGLKAAYHAYLKTKMDEVEPPLPGLNLTQRQLFFLSFAQVWCSTATAESMKLMIEKDTHAPARFRVIGPLTNLPDFSDAFNCPVGTFMNPKDKCEVW